MLLDSMFEEIKKIMLGLEIKYKVKGENTDTTESRYAADRYLNAYQQLDNFFSHQTYYVEAIKRSGLAVDDVVASEYALNPITVPEVFREAVLNEQRKMIISEYVEMNDYFRVLNGLPASTDPEVYASMSFYEVQEIDFKPVHEMTSVEIMQLAADGELQRLKEMFPKVKYLNYLGDEKIDPFVSRRADNLQVIKTNYEGDSELLDKFLMIYEQNREYVMSVLYVREFSATKPYYDNFMAMTILIMTVQRATLDVFRSGINMDFYDSGLIRMLFESYNVPFIEGLPLDYQKLLVRNLNKLLHHKSSDKVLYDISEILGFSNSAIYKYYLVKNHRFGEDGKPIFDYIEDEQGNMVENAETMYDIYFQAMDIKEENEEFALLNNTNKSTYESIIVEDPYWWDDDEDLKKKLYESEFNYVETKYLHMNVMYKLTEMIFEIVHIYRIMQDRKKETFKLDISLPRIIPSRRINLFTYTVFMCAAITKKNKLTGEIITSPSQTLHLFGFDFGQDLTKVKESITKHSGSKYIDMNKVASYIYNTDIITATDVDRIFDNIKGLWEFLSDKLKRARTIEEYRAYERLYRTLHVTQDMSSTFTKSDGTVAETYMDMIKDLDTELHEMLEEATDIELFDYINHGIDSIKDVVDSVKYLHGITDNSDVLLEALNKLVRFFKSYTVDLREFNILYILDHRYLNALKIIDKIKDVNVDVDKVGNKLLKPLVNDFIRVTSKMSKNEYARIRTVIQSLNKEYGLSDKIMNVIADKIKSVETDVFIDAGVLIDQDKYSFEKQLYDDMKIDIRDSKSMEVDIDTDIALYNKETSDISSDMSIGGKVELLDIISQDGSTNIADDNKMRDEITIVWDLV